MLSQWGAFLSGYVAIFVSSYQGYLIIIIILDVSGAAIALSNSQSKWYSVITSRSVTNSEEISVIIKELVFRDVTLCSWVRSFKRFGRSKVLFF